MKRITLLLLIILLMINCFSTSIAFIAVEPPRNYSDVSEDSWYAGAVDYVSWGLMEGDGERFFPERTMIRSELAMIIVRLAHINLHEFTYEIDPYEDVDIDSWYGKAVSWVKENGLMVGVNNTEFDPNGVITREQLCVVLTRFAEYKGESLDGSVPSEFVDFNEISEWAIDGVSNMIKCGVIKGTPGNKVSPQKGVTRAEVATILYRYSQVNNT